ncbi:Pycsar system effector family protein [Herbidospora yilanensis]|uniref:Pycsar system effector family protein n=1 Tax=Herbidospora yilanensis TaxID=354426 RepID=UPI000785B15F|nr:Pycsar system effector family protein [Herbidospora yilanensis]
MTRSDSAAEHALRLLTEAREEAGRADLKASILLAASGVAISALLGALIAGSWTPARLEGAAFLWWAAGVLGAASVATFVAAIYPRELRSRNPNRIAFFGDAAALGSVERIGVAVEIAARDHLALLSDQILVMARIVTLKYRLIKAGIWLLACAILCWSATAIFGGGAV